MTNLKTDLLDRMLALGQCEAPFIASVADFNKACRHVLSLLRDSVVLLRSGSSARAAFLAICALEETAKVSFGPYVDKDSAALKRHGILRSHPKKQVLGAGPLPLDLRKRLVDMLGPDEAERILESAWSGDLTGTRESAIYFEVSGDRLLTPEDRISPQMAHSIVVFALDTFDDTIVGMTDESYGIGKEVEALLSELAVKDT